MSIFSKADDCCVMVDPVSRFLNFQLTVCKKYLGGGTVVKAFSP
ncbi:hypothetical protein GCHA_1567 [Paraglaciecola chathamensis S18K6]|uniref:Uncharacterized protein n=1 Tax=Paraglaciecola chathamensis S18K6 TaxID=1127672 RepID=A0AAV3UWV1_9ALTE|nr:hypothetical protein GCHA_1567 [Paraglaciecola chathamensis S18K6]